MTGPATDVDTCPTHKKPLMLVDAKKLSREAQWCGTWYRCSLCHHSLLIPSNELVVQSARLAAETSRPRTAGAA